MIQYPLNQSISLTKTHCALCQSNEWQHINTIETGGWLDQKGTLIREQRYFPLGECLQCGHVQNYRQMTDDDFSFLYPSVENSPEIWPENQVGRQIYLEMIELMGDVFYQSQSVIDFGCGEGRLLGEMADLHPTGCFSGADFFQFFSDERFAFYSCDLNDAQSLAQVTKDLSFDLITVSHVMEHLISPIDFLLALRRLLPAHGHVFIEVPNCAPQYNLDIQESNLVHGQHIHYFTKESLNIVAQHAGFDCVRVNECQSFNAPRLQLLMKKNPDELKVTSKRILRRIESTGVQTVENFFECYGQAMKDYNQRVQVGLDQFKQIALWGLGGDFIQLNRQFPKIKTLISEGRIFLFDQKYAGSYFLGSKIHDPSELPLRNLPYLILPVFNTTRVKMQRFARNWQNQIL